MRLRLWRLQRKEESGLKRKKESGLKRKEESGAEVQRRARRVNDESKPENATGQAVERISGGKRKAEVRDAHDGGGRQRQWYVMAGKK